MGHAVTTTNGNFVSFFIIFIFVVVVVVGAVAVVVVCLSVCLCMFTIGRRPWQDVAIEHPTDSGAVIWTDSCPKLIASSFKSHIFIQCNNQRLIKSSHHHLNTTRRQSLVHSHYLSLSFSGAESRREQGAATINVQQQQQHAAMSKRPTPALLARLDHGHSNASGLR